MGVGIFSRRAYLFRYRGKRSCMFRNELVWAFFLEGLTCLGSEARGASVLRNEWVWRFFLEGHTCLCTGARGALCFVMNGCGDFF